MNLLNGKKVQEYRSKIISEKIEKLEKKPVLVIIQVGNNSASDVYVNQKINFGESIGVEVEVLKLEKTNEEYLRSVINDLNKNKEVDGIIVQLPLPEYLDPKIVTNFISPNKDVDGLTKNSKFIPATTRGIKTLLDEYGISIKDKKVVVIGRSDLVGKPTAKLFEKLGAEVVVCHRGTEDIDKVCKDSDILISAAGQKGLVTKDFVKEGQVVVDVGINKIDGKLYGDVCFDDVSEIVDYITPVPGGVGPMTVLSLFENLFDAIGSK